MCPRSWEDEIQCLYRSCNIESTSHFIASLEPSIVLGVVLNTFPSRYPYKKEWRMVNNDLEMI
jgi:hypothetical protein